MRNAVVMSTGALVWGRPETYTAVIDRSPCGSGTSALMANLHAKNFLKKGQQVENFSILGTKFVGKVLDESVIKSTTTAADKKTVKTSVKGRAWVTGVNTLIIHPSDPFPRGYTVGDIW